MCFILLFCKEVVNLLFVNGGLLFVIICLGMLNLFYSLLSLEIVFWVDVLGIKKIFNYFDMEFIMIKYNLFLMGFIKFKWSLVYGWWG